MQIKFVMNSEDIFFLIFWNMKVYFKWDQYNLLEGSLEEIEQNNQIYYYFFVLKWYDLLCI